MVYLFMFFFFKQKTAYEMRISDWSSDVCSSDLLAGRDQSRNRGTSQNNLPFWYRQRCGSLEMRGVCAEQFQQCTFDVLDQRDDALDDLAGEIDRKSGV